MIGLRLRLRLLKNKQSISKRNYSCWRSCCEYEGLKSKSNVSGTATNPGIDVDDEFCRNDSFEVKSSSSLSYCAAVTIRKLGGVDYLSIHQTQNEDRSGIDIFFPR